MTLKEAIEKAISTFGSSIIYERRVLSIIDDLGGFRCFPAAKIVLRELINSGLLRQYAIDNNVANRKRIVQKLVSNYGFSQENIEKVLTSIFYENSHDVESHNNHDESTPSIRLEMSDVIFMIDASKDSSNCYNTIKFVIGELAKKLKDKAKFRLILFNDIFLWDAESAMPYSEFCIPHNIQFIGSSHLSVAIEALCQCSINWQSQMTCPIIIWLASNNPVDNFKTTLDNAINNDILFKKAYRFAVTIGPSVSTSIISKFAPGNVFKSIDINEAINSILAVCCQPLNLSGDADKRLFQNKQKYQHALKYTLEELIEAKSIRFKEGIYQSSRNGKIGWIGINSEQFIPFKYEFVINYSEGLAAVSSKAITEIGNSCRGRLKPDKWGFINYLGINVIPEIYDTVRSFKYGIAFVEKDRKWGAVNKKGEIVIPLNFSSIEYASESIVRVEKNLGAGYNGSAKTCGYFNVNGQIVYDCICNDCSNTFKNNRALIKIGSEYYLINDSGNFIANIKYPYVDFLEDSDLLKISNDGNSFGVCSLDGVEIVPCKYKKFSLGKCAIGGGTIHHFCQGYEIEKKIIESTYKRIYSGMNSIVLCIGDKYVDYYTYGGVKINNLRLKSGFPFVEDFTIVQIDGIGWHKMTLDGQLTKLPFDDVYYLFSDGNLLIKYNDTKYSGLYKCALVSLTGELVRRPYLLYNYCGLEHDYYVCGEFIIFNETKSNYSKDGVKHYFNLYNGIHLDCNRQADNYNHYLHKYGNLAVIRNDNKYKILNFSTGSPLFINSDAQCVNIEEIEEISFISEDRLAFKYKGRYGYLNGDGEVVIDPIYSYAGPFENGYAFVKKDNQNLIIDKDGNFITYGSGQSICLI